MRMPTHIFKTFWSFPTPMIQGVTTDFIKLRVFPFSLQGKEKQWFYKEKNIDT